MGRRSTGERMACRHVLPTRLHRVPLDYLFHSTVLDSSTALVEGCLSSFRVTVSDGRTHTRCADTQTVTTVTVSTTSSMDCWPRPAGRSRLVVYSMAALTHVSAKANARTATGTVRKAFLKDVPSLTCSGKSCDFIVALVRNHTIAAITRDNTDGITYFR